MKSVKGFVTITDYVSNVKEEIALLGELSTWSMTFSKNKGQYHDVNRSKFDLTTFKSHNTGTGLYEVLTQSQVNNVITLVEKLIAYSEQNNTPHDKNNFLLTVSNDSSDIAINLEFGNLVTNGIVELPEWISWTDNESSDYIKIWLSDAAFRTQYDEYEIYIVPPLVTIDDFFNSYEIVKANLLAKSIAETLDTVNYIKNNNPETYLKFKEFYFYNVNNTSQKTKTNWAVIIYGEAGNNEDIIKNAISDYVANNSIHALASWQLLLPDLFRSNEFIILPRWDKVAIPNLTVNSAIYSSISNPIETIEFAINNIDFYQPQFITDNISVIPYDYKALIMIVINGSNNSVGYKTLVELFSDYIPVPSTSLDFNRMKIYTKDWVIAIESLILAAETATEYNALPIGITRIKRNNILFLSRIYDNVNYLMAVKSNSMFLN